MILHDDRGGFDYAEFRLGLMSSKLYGVTQCVVILYAIAVCILATVPYWSNDYWAYSVLISFSPLWIYALPIFVLCPLVIYLRSYVLGICVTAIMLLLLNIFKVNFNDVKEYVRSKDGLTIITANMGAGADKSKLSHLIQEVNADVVALQESPESFVSPLFSDISWHFVCASGLCLGSRYDIKLKGVKSRKLLQNYGNFAMQIELHLPSGICDFYVLHLETPREGIEALIADPIKGWDKMFDVVNELAVESWIASNWIAKGRNVIVVGDFNMSRFNPIYQRNWAWLDNSYQEAGTGFGYTKFTRWHGVQIDHVLHAYMWEAKQAWVGKSLGGDHSPLIVNLVRKES